ncbi:MAG: PqqD family protein [Lachnospiraceae bacterium]|nr:PqqD family protein [Lachnospiraceae bacterium]
MKLRKEFIVHHTESESLLVPAGGAGFSGLVKGNKTLGAILELLKTDTTEDAVLAAMKARFDAPEDILTRDVKKALFELRKIGALDE